MVKNDTKIDTTTTKTASHNTGNQEPPHTMQQQPQKGFHSDASKEDMISTDTANANRMPVTWLFNQNLRWGEGYETTRPPTRETAPKASPMSNSAKR